MIRRRFLELIALGGAGSLAASGIMKAGETNTVTYKVHGFTCVTCAVGLETMLQKRRGVSWASASYPEATVKIKYHPAMVTQESLEAFISELGFTPEKANIG
jgi:copper chaperone CopZ